MTELPFVLVHGEIIWKVVLIVFVAFVFAVIALIRRSAARVTLSSQARWRIANVTTLAPDYVMLRGRLRGGSASTFEWRGRQFHRRDPIWIECAGVCVQISGDLAIIGGSSSALVRVPAELGRSRFGRAIQRSLNDGDDVTIDGTLVHELGSATWILEPRIIRGPAWWRGEVPSPTTTTRADAMTICATTPRSAVSRLGVLSTLVTVMMAAAIGYGIMLHIGSTALESNRWEHTGSPIGRAFLVASAMPGSRDDALARLESELAFRRSRTKETFDLRLAVDDLVGSCDSRARTLLDENELEAAYATATLCGLTPLGLEALLKMGRFDAVMPDERLQWIAGLVAIATGRWSDAATAAEAIGRASSGQDQEAQEREQLRYRCLAELFRARGGDPEALGRLQRLAASNDSTCRLSVAVLLPPTARSAMLHDLDGSDEARLSAALSFIDLPARSSIRSYSFDLGYGLEWFGRWVPARVGDDEAQVVADGTHAALGAYEHDLDRVRAKAAESVLRYEPESYSRARARAIELDVALHTTAVDLLGADIHEQGFDKVDYIDPMTEVEIRLRRGEVVSPDYAGCYPGSCDEFAKALRAAQDGDGEPLVHAMDGLLWSVAAPIRAVLPRVGHARDQLAARLRYFQDEEGSFIEPFRRSRDAVMHRDLSRLAGDDATADKWQVIIDRHVSVFAHQDRLIAMLLWEQVH